MTLSQSSPSRKSMEAVHAFLRARGARLLVALCALLFFGGTAASSISMAVGDSQPALLVSQALVKHRTIRLDVYQGRLPTAFEDDYRFVEHDGHHYYYFPLGTSFFAVPAVWLANLAGLDMTVLDDNAYLQNVLASLTVVSVFLIGYQIARLYLSPFAALLMATTTVAGSSLVSTMGTAFWNLDLAVVFIMLSLWLVLRHEKGCSESVHPYGLGLLLGAAFFTRPTTATFIAVWLGYLLLRHRPAFIKAAAVSAACFLLFLLFNRVVYGQWLSPYSSFSRLQGREASYSRILHGLLASPSRGFFVFHPQFLLVFSCSLWLIARGKRVLLQSSLLFWMALTVAVVSQFVHWWGGHSYGPRLLAEVVPAFLVLGILAAHEVLKRKQGGWFRAVFFVFVPLSLFAIFIHSFQGLYNQHTVHWNHHLEPNIDDHPEAIFNWRYPQFLAANEQLCARNRNYIDAALADGSQTVKAYRAGEKILFRDSSDKALFVGWSPPEPDFRWSACRTVRILFRPTMIDPDSRYRLVLAAGSFAAQTVTLILNDQPLGQLAFPAQITPPVERSVVFAGRQLRSDTINDLTLHIPAARSYPGIFDRHIGLSFVSLTVEPLP